MNFDVVNLILLILITLLEFLAFGWLIYEMRKSHSERDKILRLEKKQIAIERRILKTLDINQLVNTPDLIEFLDHISIEGDSDVNLEELSIDIFKSNSLKRVEDLNAKYNTGCLVIGLKKENGEYVINPAQDVLLEEVSKLFVLGSSSQLFKLNKMLDLI